ncbi:MAG TPA: carboxymuconolactone decarboxylase family protein, partial [Halieaceae bacterium]|nr:carboxymuconolactone decarboxylase family protein [Halieaceae bacterium]
MRNARHTGCVMCQAVRYDVAINDGLTEEKVQMIRANEPDAELSPRERLLVAFVDQYNLDPAGMNDALRSALRNQFSEAELLHLSLLVAWFNGSSRCAVALGGMP